MTLTKEEVLEEMESAWQEFRHQVRDLDYSLDWKRDPQDPESWSVRDIISHLLGNEERNALAYLRHTLKNDGSELRLEPGNPVRTPERRASSLAQLVAELDAQYQGMRQMVLEATAPQLETRGRFLGSAGIREYTFLERAYRSVHNHLREHTQQLVVLREELGVADL